MELITGTGSGGGGNVNVYEEVVGNEATITIPDDVTGAPGLTVKLYVFPTIRLNVPLTEVSPGALLAFNRAL